VTAPVHTAAAAAFAERDARATLARAMPSMAAQERATLRLLAGGLQRRSWLVSAGGCELVLRMPERGGAPLLDVATEARIMQAAAQWGLAPAVVATEGGSLITEYCAGAVAWTPADARRGGNVARIAALLGQLHALDVNAPVFDAERIAARYLTELAAAGSVHDARQRAWAEELSQRARGFAADHAATALCHNDLVAANVLDDGALRLIDFEYAVRAAPLLDLAGLAAMNEYAQRERRWLLAAYFGEAAPSLEAELDGAIRLVRLLAYFWARLGERRAAEPQPYVELAARLAAQLGAERES
jgi:thiamine kinase-like enzyme